MNNSWALEYPHPCILLLSGSAFWCFLLFFFNKQTLLFLQIFMDPYFNSLDKRPRTWRHLSQTWTFGNITSLGLDLTFGVKFLAKLVPIKNKASSFKDWSHSCVQHPSFLVVQKRTRSYRYWRYLLKSSMKSIPHKWFGLQDSCKASVREYFEDAVKLVWSKSRNLHIQNTLYVCLSIIFSNSSKKWILSAVRNVDHPQ